MTPAPRARPPETPQRKRGRKPDLPAGDRYDRLVVGYVAFGWELASALVRGVRGPALRRWERLADRGVEPYAAWVSRFRADVTAKRAERLARWQRDDVTPAETPQEGTMPMADEDELPRSAVSLMRELFAEVLGKLEDAELFMDDDYHLSTSGDTKAAIKAEIAEYRRRFKAIEDNLYSGPNRGR